MPGTLGNVEAEMNRLNIDILGLSEVRWPGAGTQKTNNRTLYYSGGFDPERRYGTAVLHSNRITRSVIDFIPLGDRVMLIKLQTTHRMLNIIQVYAPTGERTDEEIKEFFNNLNEAMKLIKKER